MSVPALTAAGLAALLSMSAFAPNHVADETPGSAWQTASLLPRPPHVGKPKRGAKPKPTPKPAMKPSPAPTPKPMATPTTAPTAVPATPTPSPSTSGLPAVEGTLSTWVLPLGNGGGYDFSFSAPTVYADGALWWGDLGVGGGATVFNKVYASFRSTPFFQPNTWMVDALLKYRFDQGRYQVFGGYRGVGMADLNFATVGFALDRPLVSDWLSLAGRVQYGNSFSGSYLVDGQLGLSVFLDPLVLQAGFRHLALQAGTNPLFQVNGPTAGIGLRF